MSEPHSGGPVVSIVMVTYNDVDAARHTLASIEAQIDVDRSEFEVVVVDGASSDGTALIAAKSTIVTTVVSEPDRGIYDAMNKGIALARGEWIQFLNAGDAFATRESLAAAVIELGIARDTQAPWFVAGAKNLGGGNGRPRVIGNVPHSWVRHAFGLQPHCHQSCWFRRDALLAAGGHDESFGTAADFDVIFRFGLFAKPHETAEILIDYLGGGISERSSFATQRLLHAVRVKRMQLDGAARRIDGLLAMAIALRNQLKITAGRVRVRLGRFRGDNGAESV